MRKMLVLALVLGMAGLAVAADLGNQAPEKVPGVYPINVPNPVLQGGDTTGNAEIIPGLPYNDSGTTVGYNDDYSSTCYYAGGAPDVVYSLIIPAGVDGIHVALCGSTYDTGLQILDSAEVQIACNDDACGLQSEIDFVPVTAGGLYYIVVDGYSSASGSYVLDVEAVVPCILPIPDFNPAEGEPALIPDYVDNHNGGCNTVGNERFQEIQGAIMPGSDIPSGTAIFAGVSGWYLSAGSQYRDTDWFILNKAPGEAIEVTADAEYETLIFELYPRECASVGVAQQATAGPCAEAFMTITDAAADGTVWFWVGPSVFASPDGTSMYDYVLWFSGLVPEVVPTEATTWSTVKALYE